jgi:hypothetical protein
VRVCELEEIPADGTDRHNVDQWFGDHGPILSLPRPGGTDLTQLTLPRNPKLERAKHLANRGQCFSGGTLVTADRHGAQRRDARGHRDVRHKRNQSA